MKFNIFSLFNKADKTEDKTKQINIDASLNLFNEYVNSQMDKELYLNYAINTCMQKIERGCLNIELGIYKKTADGIFEQVKSPLEQLLNEPNSINSWSSFIKAYVNGIYLSGSVLIRRIRGISKDDIYVYNNQSFKISRDEDTLRITSIIFNNGMEFAGEELNDFVLVQEFNTEAILQGTMQGKGKAMVLEPLKRLINGTIAYNVSYMEHGGTLEGIINFPQKHQLTEIQKDRLKNKFDDRYTGAKNARKIEMTFEEQSPQYLGINATIPKDLDYVESLKEMEKKIALNLGIPLPLVTSDGATYNNLSEAKAELYRETIIPLMKELCWNLNKLFKDSLKDGEEFYFNESSIKALQYDLAENLKKTVDSLTGIATINDVIRITNGMFGLDLVDLGEKGETVLVSSGYTNLTDISEPIIPRMEGIGYEEE